MMDFLIFNVFRYDWNLGTAIRKCTISFLPFKFKPRYLIDFDVIVGTGFHVFKQIRKQFGVVVPDKHMDMVRH